MKQFWNRRLPAVLMALALMASLVPAALAAGHVHQYTPSHWQQDGSSHWHACTVPGCTARTDEAEHTMGNIIVDQAPTCWQNGSGHQVCSVCGYSRTVSLPATKQHTASSGWSFDETSHWHPCTTPGCTARLEETNHSFPAWVYTSDKNFHWQTCSICGGTSKKVRHIDGNQDGICDVCQRSFDEESEDPGEIPSVSGGTILYRVTPGTAVNLHVQDFIRAFQADHSGADLRYVTFSPNDGLDEVEGSFYTSYQSTNELRFSQDSLERFAFYGKDSADGDFALNSLSFVAGSQFKKPLEVPFTAWYSENQQTQGVLRIQPQSARSGNAADLLYVTQHDTPVQLNPNDFARFLQKRLPGKTLSHVELLDVPDAGSLYYDYYGVSPYGGSHKWLLTPENCGDQSYYFSPASAAQCSLSELTYQPKGMNYCTTIPFVVHAQTGQTVSGNLLISVTYQKVAEVYGATPKGVSVTFPGHAISTVVSNATGAVLDKIQLLALPDASCGMVYVGNEPADKTSRYALSSGKNPLAQLRFVPSPGFTGSVELPYLAYSSNGTAVGSGRFCLGVVSSLKKYQDLPSSAWCYKYVTELSDAKVIDGYPDGTFHPDNVVTYGQALKLILLAAGYPVQPPTDPGNVFSGYLVKAQAENLISGKVNLQAPISRLAVAQIAAKALKLDISHLSSVNPFTDTKDPYVRALNAAGIVEGYFSNGTSRYQPNNTLTRGQVSAIVWRMLRNR